MLFQLMKDIIGKFYFQIAMDFQNHLVYLRNENKKMLL